MSERAMVRQLRAIAPVLISVVFLEISASAYGPIIGVQLTLRDVPAAMIGTIASAYFIGFASGSLLAGRMLDRVGHIRALSVFAILALDTALLMVLFDHPWTWLVLRCIAGFAMAGIWVTIETWLSHKAAASARGRVFGVYMLVSSGFSALAPLLLTVADPAGATVFLVIAICYAAGIVPMALTRESNPEIADRARFGIVKLYAISPLGVATAFGSGLAGTAFVNLLPVYTQGVGLTPTDFALLLFISRTGNLLCQYPVGQASDRVGRRPMILAAAMLGLAGALVGLVHGAQSHLALVAAAVIFTIATSPLYALAISYANDNCAPRDIVAANGGLLSVWAIGGIAGPTVAGWTMQALGPDGLFVYLAATLAALTLFALYRMTRRPAPPPRPREGDQAKAG